MTPDASAHTVWAAVESQFLDNQETRALLLDAQFRGFKQGDLSISDYCRRLKTMADQLGNLGEPVSDRTLVLNLVRGLNAKYTAIGRHIRRGRPFPTFLEAKNDLLLEEITVGASLHRPPRRSRRPTLCARPTAAFWRFRGRQRPQGRVWWRHLQDQALRQAQQPPAEVWRLQQRQQQCHAGHFHYALAHLP